jgi:hypothetical protein
MAPVPSPLSASQLVDEYFIENRTRLLEVAAFLDRLDRAGPGAPDHRMEAFREALDALGAAGGLSHTERVQLIFSDPTQEPREALDRKSAVGAYDRRGQEVG